jgi:WD40 repeat protein
LGQQGFPESLAFSLDGKLLGTTDQMRTLRLWDVGTGKLLHTLRDSGWCLTFSPDGTTVATGGRDGIVKLWDITTGKQQASLRVAPANGIDFLAYSPDGQVLAVGGQRGVHLWSVQARKEVQTLPDWIVMSLAFAPDGKTLAALGLNSIRFWDFATGKQLLPPSGHDDSVNGLAVSPDGKVLASGSYPFDGTLCLWDTRTGKLLHRLSGREIAHGLTCFSPDGKLVASRCNDGFVRLIETADGKEKCRLPILDRDPNRSTGSLDDPLLFSADGKWLAATTRDRSPGSYEVRVCDIATEKLLKQRNLGARAFLLPDARGVVVPLLEGLSVRDMLTGNEIVKIPGVVYPRHLTFSPDGRLLATVLEPAPLPGGGGGAGKPPILVVDVATGKIARRIESDRPGMLAFSTDGRLLAIGGYDRPVRLLEVATGKEAFRLPRSEGRAGARAYAPVYSVAFLPSGRALATGLMDGTVPVWDMAPEAATARELGSKDLDSLWADLAGDDARKAYRALHTLAASPAQSIPYLRDHLQPSAAVEPKRQRELFADLGSEAFSVREAAAKELAELGERVEPALRQELEGKPSAEVRRRIEALLAAPRGAPSGGTLQALRAIWVLEQIGTPEARQVLRTLAGGAAARETREAAEALKRLARRRAAKP